MKSQYTEKAFFMKYYSLLQDNNFCVHYRYTVAITWYQITKSEDSILLIKTIKRHCNQHRAWSDCTDVWLYCQLLYPTNICLDIPKIYSELFQIPSKPSTSHKCSRLKVNFISVNTFLSERFRFFVSYVFYSFDVYSLCWYHLFELQLHSLDVIHLMFTVHVGINCLIYSYIVWICSCPVTSIWCLL